MNPQFRRALLGVVAAAVLAVAAPQAAAAETAPIEYGEREAATAAGLNDSQPAAERLAGFGTGWWQNPKIRVAGTLPDLTPTPTATPAGTEDNGAIPLATATGIGGAITTTGKLGDGPHGSTGTARNDFDFYKLTASRGYTLRVNTEGSVATTDTVVAVYNAAGQLLASDDDGGTGLRSLLVFEVPVDGDYYVLVAGHSPRGSLPADPTDSGSGSGGADEGNYKLLISSSLVDKDFYTAWLRKGDVLGGSVSGAAGRLAVHRFDGVQSVGSDQDLAARYPAASPLPRGGNASVAYVAEESGWYAVSVRDGFGAYSLTLDAYRPGSETDTKVQTVFLDFDGGMVDLGSGPRDLTPLSSFLDDWGLAATDESALVTTVVAVVTENIRTDLIAKGLNPNVAVRILNSRDHVDHFGKENVSRVVVGGGAGIAGVSAAQSVDPGNFAHEESAVVQLDGLAAAAGPASINSYLTADSNRVAFVGQVLGNLASREIGQLSGSQHTDQTNGVANLMDADGNFPQLFGVGPDAVGGTADDTDVDFGEDAYAPAAAATGLQDTLNNTAWGLSRPCG